MKKCLLLGLFLWGLVATYAQSKDVHKRSTYYAHSKQLKLRFEYYYDYWAEQDVKHGRYTEWTQKGTIIKDCMYEDNLLVGEERLWTETGALWKIRFWDKGHLQAEKLFYSNGLLREHIVYDDMGKVVELKKYDSKSGAEKVKKK